MQSENNTKLEKTNKFLMRVLIAVLALLAVAIVVAIFYNPKPSGLPEQFKQDVTNIVSQDKRFTVNKIELLSSGTIQIMLSLDTYPNTENFISLNVKTFINEIEKKYNYDLDISMLVYMPIEGTDKIRYFGKGSFNKSIGKIEYEPAK